MRAPIGNNGNLKNNWRVAITNYQRKSLTNIGLAGYPTFVPDAGNDTNKIVRRKRFYRQEIRHVVQDVAEKNRELNKLYSSLDRQERILESKEAIILLAQGTQWEEATSSEVDAIHDVIDSIWDSIDALEDEIDAMEADIEGKNGLIKNIVGARYMSKGFGS